MPGKKNNLGKENECTFIIAPFPKMLHVAPTPCPPIQERHISSSPLWDSQWILKTLRK